MMDGTNAEQPNFESAMEGNPPPVPPRLSHIREGAISEYPIKIKKMRPKVQVQILPTPVKSASDQKQYKVIRLPNGLTACLISDPTALNNEYEESGSDSDYGTDESGNCKKGSQSDEDSQNGQKVHNQKLAGATLCVDVGSFSDPKSIPGLAHFVEHLVFMGTEKFPRENDYHSFFWSRGGFGNGTTNVETTTFYFRCLKNHLCEGLDKLAQFFISPRMLHASIIREREAVDSEFQEGRPTDKRRRSQLLKNLAKEDSPVNNFAIGNVKTLKDNVKLSALDEAVHEFRKRHYSAHRMTLAIQAGLPIEQLEAYVLDCFADVPCNNLPPDDFSKFKDNVHDMDKWNRIYFIKSCTNDNSVVKITFALPSLMDNYKTKPLSYVSGILGDKGKGSLISYLRKKVWALNVTFQNLENDINYNRLYSFLSIKIHLTAEGLENLFTVVETVFSFINMTKTLGPQENIYNEMKQIKDISFRFAAEQPVYDNVRKMAKSMRIHPPEDYLTGPDLFYEYDSKCIKMVMDHLVPRNANITVSTIKTNLFFTELKQRDFINYDKTEKWYGTRYTDLSIPEEHLFRWENAQPSDEFALPPPNQFITENFEIVPPAPFSDVPAEVPVRIVKNNAMELWHRKDEKFKLPTAIWYIGIQTYLLLNTSRSSMLSLFLDLFKTQVSEAAWPAKKAKLSYEVSKCRSGLVIKVSGPNEKLPSLIGLLMKHLKSFTSNLTEETFAAVKDRRIKFHHNWYLDTAHIAEYVSKRVSLKCPSVKYLLRYLNGCDSLKNNYQFFDEVITGITFKDMKTFAEQLLKELYVTILVQGNLSAEQASLVAQNIVRDLHYKCKFKSAISSIINKIQNPQHQTQKISWATPLCKVLCLLMNPKPEIRCVKSLNESDSNSTVINYYRGNERDTKTRMVLEMLVLLIQEPLFSKLRTDEQLGYTVRCSVRDTFGCLGISVNVNLHANKYSTRYVNERIDLFMKRMWKALKDMTESEFEEAKLHLIKKKQCSDNNLQEEAARNWSEIFFKKEYLFDRLERQVKSIKEMNKSDLLNWWETNIFCEKTNQFTYKKMSTQVIGYGDAEKVISNESVYCRVLRSPILLSSVAAAALYLYCTRRF